MEEEYRCALQSSSQERARLEGLAESLEEELLEERTSHAARYTVTFDLILFWGPDLCCHIEVALFGHFFFGMMGLLNFFTT